MKITKRQIRRIIREEYEKLPQAGDPTEAARLKAQRDSARIPNVSSRDKDNLKMIATVIDNLTEMALGYDVDKETKSDLLSQVELLNGVYNSMYNKTTGYRK